MAKLRQILAQIRQLSVSALGTLIVYSISAHDSTRVSIIEAYHSVHNYDLIGIVETHFDCSIDESKLTLDGYSFFKNNHPQNIKSGVLATSIRT